MNLKKIVIILYITMLFVSCKKEDGTLAPQYDGIFGTWSTQSISWDSLGIRVTHSSPFDILVIRNDLSYTISMNLINPVENGTIKIISQNSAGLEIFFAAKYPDYSSFAGSHIFGMSNVVLVSLESDELVFSSVDQVYYPGMEFRFRR